MRKGTVKSTRLALRWIVCIMRRRGIPFQITGGFAAWLYGSRRPVNDIDIAIPYAKLKTIMPDVQPRVVFGPKRYRDKQFDAIFVTVKYRGQDIEIGGNERFKIYDRQKRRWHAAPVDLSTATQKVVFGMRVPVTPKERLIAIKRMLSRKQDGQDILAMNKCKKAHGK